nr:hypothetical protein [Bradyrhizobium sp. CCBAU 11357]
MLIDTSKIFDSIRINKKAAQERQTAALCEWPGCQNKGTHPAPKGRDNAREYWHFCINHEAQHLRHVSRSLYQQRAPDQSTTSLP